MRLRDRLAVWWLRTRAERDRRKARELRERSRVHAAALREMGCIVVLPDEKESGGTDA